MKTLLLTLLGAAVLAKCQQPLPAALPPAAPAAALPPAGAPTAAAARAAIGRYLQSQPNAELYVVDSARATDLGAYWQVLVPRTDWARRTPNRAGFEVDKQSGTVKSLLVK